MQAPGDSVSLSNASDRISPDVDRQAMAARPTPLLYAATLLVSALLLFSIQPMFARMALPKPSSGKTGSHRRTVKPLCCSDCGSVILLQEPGKLVRMKSAIAAQS